MEEKVKYCDFSSRTMEFYQRSEDIYIDIIGVLWELSDKLGKEGPSWALEYLNKASYWKAIIDSTPEEQNPARWLSDNENNLMLCILACIAADNYRLMQRLLKRLLNDPVYYPSFRYLISESLAKANNPIRIEEENRQQKEKIKELKATISEQAHVIWHLNRLLNEKPLNNKSKKAVVQKSVFENLLSYDTILDWTIKQKKFADVEQVYLMLSEIMRNVATDEEYKKYDNAKESIKSKENPTIVNNQVNSNGGYIFFGDVVNPNFPSILSKEQMIELRRALDEELNS